MRGVKLKKMFHFPVKHDDIINKKELGDDRQEKGVEIDENSSFKNEDFSTGLLLVKYKIYHQDLFFNC